MAQFKARGSNAMDLSGKHYEGTVKVDTNGKNFIRENASSIYYDAEGGTWRVGGGGTSTTLARAMYRDVTGKKPGRRVGFANGDNTDLRATNLV